MVLQTGLLPFCRRRLAIGFCPWWVAAALVPASWWNDERLPFPTARRRFAPKNMVHRRFARRMVYEFLVVFNNSMAGDLALAANEGSPGAGWVIYLCFGAKILLGNKVQWPQHFVRRYAVFCGAVGLFQRPEHLVGACAWRCWSPRMAAAPCDESVFGQRRAAHAGTGAGAALCGHHCTQRRQ